MNPTPESPAQTQKGASYFHGAHHLHIENQQITHIENQTLVHLPRPSSSEGPESDNASKPILDASHLRNRKTSPPDSNCIAGTRRAVIQEITKWASAMPLGKQQHIFWLYGYVGCGKSAIAQAVSEQLARQDRLAASFFFFRGSGDRSRTKRLAATIARQMSASVPEMGMFVKAARRKHPGIFSFPLETQFELLIFQPFDAATNRGLGGAMSFLRRPYLIVIDGLDECEDRDEVEVWIRRMVAYFVENPKIALKVFICSRVEEHIRNNLNSPEVKLVNLVDHSPHEDIAFVMNESLKLAAEQNRVIRSFGPDWPSREYKRKLIQHIGGSFVFLTTILKYILDPGVDHKERLEMALDLNPGLDGLYTETLSLSRHLPHFSDVISIVARAARPCSITTISGLLDVEPAKVISVLTNLHSILQVPGDDRTPVTVCHSSLIDFLTDESRSKSFFAPPSYHLHLFKICLRLLTHPVDHRADPLKQQRIRAARIYASKEAVVHFAQYCELHGSGGSITSEIIGLVVSACEQYGEGTYDYAVAVMFHTHRRYLNLYPNQSVPTGQISKFVQQLLPLPNDEEASGLLGLLLDLDDYKPSWLKRDRNLDYPYYHLQILKSILSMVVFSIRDPGGNWPVILFPTGRIASDVLLYMRSFCVQHLNSALKTDVSTLRSELAGEMRINPLSGTLDMVEDGYKFSAKLFYGKKQEWLSVHERMKEFDIPGVFERASTRWKWNSHARGVTKTKHYHVLTHGQGFTTSLTLLEVIVGYVQLAVCMHQVCDHEERGADCPSIAWKKGDY